MTDDTYGQPGLTQSSGPGATAISAAEVKNYSKVITTADDMLEELIRIR